MPKQGKSQDHFAVVEFEEDKSEPSKRLIEVIRYAWLTEDGKQCFCPSSKNWIFELKNCGIPRGDWVKHACRVLKYNIDSIKAANIECSLRLNYTTSDTEEYQNHQKPEKKNSSSAVISNDYNNLFDQLGENDSLVMSNNDFETIQIQPTRNDCELETPSSCTATGNSNENEIMAEQPIDSVVCIQYDSFQKALQDLTELKQGQLNSELVALKVDQIQSNLEKISAQNEIMMKMISEFCKKSPASSTFTATTNIDSKSKLDELELQLQENDFKENMAYAYTQYASKGDAKKEVNGFAKSILNKLLSQTFAQQIRWDRIKKVDNLPAEDCDTIFFKKYNNILEFIVEVSKKNRKDLSFFYNKDNICQTVQDFFKRMSYKKS